MLILLKELFLQASKTAFTDNRSPLIQTCLSFFKSVLAHILPDFRF